MDNDLSDFFGRKIKECPKGVKIKIFKDNIYLRFTLPYLENDTKDTRVIKPCNCTFSETGIILAVDKAHKVAEALKRFRLSSEFWTWYNNEILEKSSLENDLLTYRDIFQIISDRYWSGRNRNTGRKRSQDIANDVATFSGYYRIVFNKFPNHDHYPTWPVIKSVLFSWTQGTKSFKDVYTVIMRICELSANSKELLGKLEKIDSTQSEFKESQSISLNEFLNWYIPQLEQTNSIKDTNHKKSKKSWLWVIAMIVVYGLRPSEIAAAKNLLQPITIGEITIPALNDPENQDLLLVLDDFTYFGTSIKTGGRICKPMTTDKELIKKLDIQNPSLLIINFDKDIKPESIVKGFNSRIRIKLERYKCPVTETYALRHLSNQLGELYGIPQEIRARSLGHSVAINESIYKKRSNTETTINLLTNYSRLPISLNLAKEKLTAMGIDITDPLVEKIIKIIYQI
jgi:hypothetical protein